MTDVYTQIEEYSRLSAGIDDIQAQKQALIDSVLTPEIRDQLAEIDAEFDPKVADLKLTLSILEAQIKEQVLIAGQTVKGSFHQFVYSKPRVSWDTKMLDGYAMAHPEILRFRKEGNPSVSVRGVK